VINQSHTGGATGLIRYNSLLANVHTEPNPSGAESVPFWLYANESGAEEHENDGSLTWASENLDQLVKDYPNKWIAVKNKRVLESSDGVVELLVKTSKVGIRKPLILKMEPAPHRKWRTAF
jgi:hypothetical protein